MPKAPISHLGSSSQPAVKLLLLLSIQKLSFAELQSFSILDVGSDTSQIFVFRWLPDFFVLLSQICEEERHGDMEIVKVFTEAK